MYMMLLCFAQSLGGCSVTGGHSLALLSRWGMLPCFAQSLWGHSLTFLSRWGMLPHFAQSLGGRSLTFVSCWGDALSLRSVTGGMLPRITQSLWGCSLTSLSCWGDAPSLCSVAGGHFLTSLSHSPFNGSIKLLQNLHSRGSMKQHFYVWEPRCGYLHKVKRANGAINMHLKGSNELLPKY